MWPERTLEVVLLGPLSVGSNIVYAGVWFVVETFPPSPFFSSLAELQVTSERMNVADSELSANGRVLPKKTILNCFTSNERRTVRARERNAEIPGEL